MRKGEDLAQSQALSLPGDQVAHLFGFFFSILRVCRKYMSVYIKRNKQLSDALFRHHPLLLPLLKPNFLVTYNIKNEHKNMRWYM